MNAAIRIAAFIAFCFAASCAFAQAQPRAGGLENLAEQSAEQMRTGIETKHPAAFYALAKTLFEAGEKDEAVFWFYAGQIRYRAYLMSNPQLKPDGDPAVFASLSEVIGRPINVYAFGDIAGLAKTIDRALVWDAANPDGFAKGPEREKSRSGLSALKAKILSTAGEIRATRTKNGLENRTQ